MILFLLFVSSHSLNDDLPLPLVVEKRLVFFIVLMVMMEVTTVTCSLLFW